MEGLHLLLWSGNQTSLIALNKMEIKSPLIALTIAALMCLTHVTRNAHAE